MLCITFIADEIRQAALTSPPPEVTNLPEFQVNGRFDMEKWQQFVIRGSNPEFLLALEQRYRDEIPYVKFLQFLTADVYVSDAQLWRMYRDERDSVTIAALAVTPAVIPDSAAAVTDLEAQRYFEAHRDAFKRPAVAYLSFVALPRRPDAADTAAALARARALRARVLRGEAFDAVAKTQSADSGSAAHGGDLGWIHPDSGGYVLPFLNAVRHLRPGQVSEPVVTEFGYHLIRVDAARGDSVKVRHILVPIELRGTHRDLVESRTDTLDRLAAEQENGAELDSVAQRLQLPLAHAPPLVQGDRLQLGRWVIPDVSVWAFDTKVGETSQVIEATPAYYVFRLDSLTPGGAPPFAEVKEAAMAGAPWSPCARHGSALTSRDCAPRRRSWTAARSCSDPKTQPPAASRRRFHSRRRRGGSGGVSSGRSTASRVSFRARLNSRSPLPTALVASGRRCAPSARSAITSRSSSSPPLRFPRPTAVSPYWLSRLGSPPVCSVDPEPLAGGVWRLRGSGGSSLRLRLNSLIPCPIDEPISGMRLAPKTSTRISSRIRMWLNDRSENIAASLKERPGHEVGDRHSHDGEQRDVEPDRAERDRHHQQIHVHRSEGRRHGGGEKLLGGALRQEPSQQRVEQPAEHEARGEHAKVK